MPGIEIRPASLSQAETLAEIHAASFGAAAWNLEQIKGSLSLGTTQGWVALEDGKALGFVLCQTGSEQTEILTFGVTPSAQRQGIGEMLVEKAIEEAGAAKIFLEVAADNHAAKALYKKLGFHKTGIRPDYYRRGKNAVDAVFYERQTPAHKG